MSEASEISVLLLSYNPSKEDLRVSLSSIVAQQDCRYQLLVVDDHSQDDPQTLVDAVMADLDSDDYEYLRHERNMRTVHSVRAALEKATGKYVKLIGAGDALYDSGTLRAIVDFCEEHDAACGFGNIVLMKDEKPFRFPSNASDYPPEGTVSREELFKHQISKADWIPGCSQFYRTDFFAKMLGLLADHYGVNFCEDFSETIALLYEDVWHLDRPIIRYDWGDGISTNGSLASRTRLYDDHAHFFAAAHDDKPFGSRITMPYAMFRLKRFIALKTPVYPLLQRLFARMHME